jgi:FMN phosphatase YigB (HAD superfamily)
MYVGDHPTQDIDPANQLGMITVHIRRGRHAPEQGKTKAAHELKNFKELLTVLRKDYSVRA